MLGEMHTGDQGLHTKGSGNSLVGDRMLKLVKGLISAGWLSGAKPVLPEASRRERK